MSDLQSENKEELDEHINDEYRKEKREQQTSRLLIDEEKNKYRIDYICKVFYILTFLRLYNLEKEQMFDIEKTVGTKITIR